MAAHLPVLALALALFICQSDAYSNTQCVNMGYYGAGSYVLPASTRGYPCNQCGIAFVPKSARLSE